MFSNGGTDHWCWKYSSLEFLLVATGSWLPLAGVEERKRDEEEILVIQNSSYVQLFHGQDFTNNSWSMEGKP